MNTKKLLSVLTVIMMVSVCFSAPFSSGAQSEHTISVQGDHGTFADSEGNLYTGGTFAGPMTITFNPVGGYEFVEWNVTGECVHTENLNHITISSVSEDITVTAVTRNYSTSHGLMSKIDVDNLLGPEDDIVNNWSFASTELVREGNEWGGMPSVPLIVGDYVYIRAGEYLYKVDADNGLAVKFIESPGNVSFYHYISYDGGVIFDTIAHKAYDLDFKYLYDIPANLEYATYYDGYFYGFIKVPDKPAMYQIFKTSVDIDKDVIDSVKVNISKNTELFMVHEQYGQHSPFIMQNGWLFFLQADKFIGKTGYRAITAYDTITEKTVTAELTGFTGMPWDDGWLTYNNGYFYLTAYVAGLFGGGDIELSDKNTSLMWVKFDFQNGRFEEQNYMDFKTPGKDGHTFKGIASGFVINGGRGYVNVRASPDDTMGHTNDIGTCLLSYDIMENGRPEVREAAPSYMTHGGIVVNTAHEDEGKVHIYLIPYESSAQGIYIFTDERQDNGRWVLDEKYVKKSPTRVEWGSQGIRAGPNGEIIYYVDDGYIGCYIPDYKNKVTVLTMDSDTAVSSSGYGQNAGIVLDQIYPGIAIADGRAVIGSDIYRIYGMNETYGTWVKINDPYTSVWSGEKNEGITSAQYHHIALLKDGASPHFRISGWYYTDDGGHNMLCDMSDVYSVDAAVGKFMRYYNEAPSGIIIPDTVHVPYLGSVTVMISDVYDWSYTAPDQKIVRSVKNADGSITLTYVSDGETQMTVKCGDDTYVISIDIVKTSYVDGDGWTVSESVFTDTEDGLTFHNNIVVRSKDTIVESVAEVTVADASGKIVRTERTVSETDRHGEFRDGHYIEMKSETRIAKDPDGNRISDISYGSEKYETEEYDGTVTVHLHEVINDNLTGKQTVIDSLLRTKDTVTVVEETVKEKNQNGDYDIVSEDVKTHSSFDEDTKATVEGDTLTIELSGSPVVNIDGMVDAMNPDGNKNVVLKTSSPVTESIMASASDKGASLEYMADHAAITLSSDSLRDFSTKGELTFSADPADESMFTQAQKTSVGNMPAFDLTIKCGKAQQHDFGQFSIKLKCDMEQKQGMKIQVWRIDEDGNRLPAQNVSYADGTVSFDADHLSVYTVGYVEDDAVPESGSSDDGKGSNNTMIFAGIGAVVAVLAVAGIFLLKRRG